MRYIRQVQVEFPGTRSEHIIEVKYSTTAGGALTARSRASVVQDIDGGTESYRSHNDRTGDEAPVGTRRSVSGLRYIATVANDLETDNLLSLPRY